jgi:hypothetical protein
MPMLATPRSLVLAVALAACSGAPSEPEAPAARDAAVAPDRATPPRDEPHARPEAAPADRTAPAAAAVGEVECEPRVTEVLFVPDGAGLSVTILGEGFCRGAAPASARFGDVPVTDVVVASSGTSMAGRVARMPPAGATLEVHTPPGRPVITSWVVPGAR